MFCSSDFGMLREGVLFKKKNYFTRIDVANKTK